VQLSILTSALAFASALAALPAGAQSLSAEFLGAEVGTLVCDTSHWVKPQQTLKCLFSSVSHVPRQRYYARIDKFDDNFTRELKQNLLQPSLDGQFAQLPRVRECLENSSWCPRRCLFY
jgi:hypothetical protein